MLEGVLKFKMDSEKLLNLIKTRRSIRKYQDRQISESDLKKVIEAGIWAPNAGGGQHSKIIGVHDKNLTEYIGKLNIAHFDRTNLAGSYVSEEQPSIIDDPNIKSAFYGVPSVCVIFGQEDFLYSIPDAFCCAENMVLMAHSLGLASCIIARAEETFTSPVGQQLLKKWEIPENFIARCFVLLGYIEGTEPHGKIRYEGRVKIVS